MLCLGPVSRLPLATTRLTTRLLATSATHAARESENFTFNWDKVGH